MRWAAKVVLGFAAVLGLSAMVVAQTQGQAQMNVQLEKDGQSQTQPAQVMKLAPQQQAPVQAKIGTGLASQSLEAYLERVRTQASGERPEPGSIWSDNGRFTRMTTDVRAMRPHDLVSVVVSESLAASTDGTVNNSRVSNANWGISGLIGTLKAGKAPQNLVTQSSSSGLNAQGQSATNSSLSTTLGARWWRRCRTGCW